ncbi:MULTISPECIES: energy-coupling factor transporter ATPase [unclassified Candidatus Frackibacter]|uniref:energy-coupling factor transporter ATPase n=1 Tax=unclassified Candidatus Frackibacter TaxID=2648818 RepID=UPI0007968E21|nr:MULTISPECIES: energy-coupling factor transporter ATPase [unclassified Candidatus Frackibacter]KXS45795.1 MAG: cobalt/nickel transport system ATP-binding protein [Candidatus Frackibacter sp. T328-2]SDC22748.1 energy-coupling factor transport system ATP-binding protein [Candidatus Frackibacter sp. WG11]SEM49143.1 energy-coupling factor transport system ATP-binding protein [Candidatus Frackibacter sp. WG12]SFL50738.1 energy-coupling factor transport system ATP-binding protein [Candidatus Fracki
MLIKVESVTHQYDDMGESVLNDINFSINKNEFISLIGHTGSGKSTLVQILNGLIKPISGQVFLSGEDITGKDVDLKKVRQQVGLVFQYPEHQLFEETVYQDVAFGPKNLGLSEETIEDRVKDSLKSVNLEYEEFKDRSPFKLSGGQQRRVAIAGVLAMRPKVLILDEPTAGLDPRTRIELMEEIIKFKEEFNLTIILVSHRMEEVFQLADRILVLSEGQLVFNESPTELTSKYHQLQQLGLGVPEITEVLVNLKEKGYDLNTNIFDILSAKDEIIKVLRS